jgi:CoA:oxalate CoA-transferase
MTNEVGRSDRGPLAGIRILDLTRVLAGPYITGVLADMGAEVIKIEDVSSGDPSRRTPPFINGISNAYANINRNKIGIAIDLKTTEGREEFLKLVRNSDIVIENFRAGVLERLDLEYPKLYEANPGVILCSISGFGRGSSYQHRPAFDLVIQALSGVMSVTGDPGGPPTRLGIPVADVATGLYAGLGILAALQERYRTGRGQAIDVGMLDVLVHMTVYYPIDYLNAGELPAPIWKMGRHHHVVPYGMFEVMDGYAVIAIMTENFWAPYCRTIGHPELADDARFASQSNRLDNGDELYAILDEIMKTRTRQDWEERFVEGGVPYAPVLTIDEMANHPLAAEREMFVPVDHPIAGRLMVAGPPIKFLDRDLRPVAPAPLHGEHTREVLIRVAGTPRERVLELERLGAVKQANLPT